MIRNTLTTQSDFSAVWNGSAETFGFSTGNTATLWIHFAHKTLRHQRMCIIQWTNMFKFYKCKLCQNCQNIIVLSGDRAAQCYLSRSGDRGILLQGITLQAYTSSHIQPNSRDPPPVLIQNLPTRMEIFEPQVCQKLQIICIKIYSDFYCWPERKLEVKVDR